MQPLLELAQHREQEAARILGSARRALRECRQRMDELIRFRDEYRAQLQSDGQRGLNGSRLRTYEGFIRQLEMAIVQQQQLIHQAEHHCQDHARHWQQLHQRSEMLDKTLQRSRYREHRLEQRKEQREQDEQSQNRFRRHTYKS
jgi:flagellar FliJ protein